MFEEAELLMDKLKYRYENKLYSLSLNSGKAGEISPELIMFDLLKAYIPEKTYTTKKKTILYVTKENDRRYALECAIYANRDLFKNLNLSKILANIHSVTLLERKDNIDVKIISQNININNYETYYSNLIKSIENEGCEIILLLNDRVIDWKESMYLQNGKHKFPCVVFEDIKLNKNQEEYNLRGMHPNAIWTHEISLENPRGNA